MTSKEKNNNERKLQERFRGTLVPIYPVLMLSGEGPVRLAPAEITADQVGWKAYGLCCLPERWVPPFFVVAASSVRGYPKDSTSGALLDDCIRDSGLSADGEVYVRSSGTEETLDQRGRLDSERCAVGAVSDAIQNLLSNLNRGDAEQLHWIVQEAVAPVRKGHLSNVRRLSREGRDWVVEIEPDSVQAGYTTRIAVRNWRDAGNRSNATLACSSETEISICLKRVAIWATRLASRMHFEWVWDGQTIMIVQADAEEHNRGTVPRSLLQGRIPEIKVDLLRVFRIANSSDYDRYKKLRNAKLYKSLGYEMPVFYVLDDVSVLKSIREGLLPSPCLADLEELTKRPLLIRTDGDSIPQDKREMLPRSEDLRSSAQARKWLLGDLNRELEHNDLWSSDLCLIAHHFIPSVASAWARAEPDSPIVRIEALWGVPEGLYWFSHDIFEIDTTKSKASVSRSGRGERYTPWKHLRYKGLFVAPDQAGRWITHSTRPPYDWTKSITQQQWLFEIAETTRQIARTEKHPVSVMWFVDNHLEMTRHRILPWYHMKSDLSGPFKPAAPRHKYHSTDDRRIETRQDWEDFKSELASGKRTERVVVEPIDPELIRNRGFAEELGKLASEKKFVVELAGGILSHAYYLLRRLGADVECVDLFGIDEDIVEYNKIVRDKIPKQIESRGERVESIQLKGDALVLALKRKLVEEAYEALDARSGEDLVSELADLHEVVLALLTVIRSSVAELENERKEKRRRRGGFTERMMLVKTATLHSIKREQLSGKSRKLDLKTRGRTAAVISNPKDLPSDQLYRRPDLRYLSENEVEKLITFELTANQLAGASQTYKFQMPFGQGTSKEFELGVQLIRERSRIRGVISLRSELMRSDSGESKSPQLELNLPESK